MPLAIFDLDNTLIGGDSDSLWTEFLIEKEALGPEAREKNERFYSDYVDGRLDIEEFLRFQLEPLRRYPPQRLYRWRLSFLTEKIHPILLPKAFELLEKHRGQGHRLLIMTATNRFITEPIAALLGVEDLLATDLEMIDGHFTGRMAGVPCFREGKIRRLNAWIDSLGALPRKIWFYSDSQNDIPLLDCVDDPVAVDPDPVLAAHASQHGWPVISLR